MLKKGSYHHFLDAALVAYKVMYRMMLELKYTLAVFIMKVSFEHERIKGV